MMEQSRSLTAAYFFLGAFALVSQTMILREFFVVVYGNEFIFGVLLANWLIGIFTGAILGSATADHDKNNREIFSLALILLSVLFPLSITAIRFLYTISGTPMGTYVSFSDVALYSALFIIPVSFFIGFAFPVAARIHTGAGAGANTGKPAQNRVQKISAIYIVEALGSLLSGIIYTFFLVGRFSPYFIAALFTLPLLVSCWAALNKTPYKILRFITAILLIVNALALTPFIHGKIETVTVEKRWHSFSQLPLNYSLDSKYQNIAVSKFSNQYNLYLNTMLAAVFPNDEDNMILAAHLVAQHPPAHQPLRVLVIGDAVSGLAGYLLRFNVEKLISVEIDPKVVETILNLLPAREKQTLEKYRAGGRFEIKTRDGRKYVKDLVEGREPGVRLPYFDIVFINVPEPSTLLLNRFYTVEFFADCARILRKNGVAALRVTAAEDYTQGIVGDYTASIYNTVASVFPYVTAAPGTQAFIFAAQDPGVVSDTPALLEKRYTQTGVSPDNLGLIFHSLYPPGKTAAVNNALRSHPRYRLNTDENPTAGFYFNKIIGWYGKSRMSQVLEVFETVAVGDIVIIALVLFFCRLAYIALKGKPTAITRRRALKFHTLLAVFCGGMAGLSLELVIIYTYQYNFGSVYHIIGFIIAIFMFGLPMGAWVSATLINRGQLAGEPAVIKAIIFILAVIAAIAFLLPYMVTIFNRFSPPGQFVIFLQTIMTGFAVGFLFPLAVHLYLGGSEKTGRAAGIIDAFDHMGAAVGAFFTGSLFLPVMGMAKVCLLLALFPLLSLLLLLTDVFSPNLTGEMHEN